MPLNTRATKATNNIRVENTLLLALEGGGGKPEVPPLPPNPPTYIAVLVGEATGAGVAGLSGCAGVVFVTHCAGAGVGVGTEAVPSDGNKGTSGGVKEAEGGNGEEGEEGCCSFMAWTTF
jgi:hypothetical protein